MNKPGGGTDTSKRVTTISWIPFKEMGHMYQDLNKFIQKANENHFGFGDIQVTENAQFTEYPEGCLLYTSPSPRDRQKSRMPSSA